MPKKFVKKKVAKKAGPKKNAFGHTEPSKVKLITLHMPLKKGAQMFPDRYMVTAHNQFIADVNIAGTASTQSYFSCVITANSFAPSNFAIMYPSLSGTFTPSQNVPSGLFYLLGNPNKGVTNTGGQAPYIDYRVHSCMIKASYIPVLAGVATTSANSQLTIFPTNTAPYNSGTDVATSFSAYSNTQLAEQPYAVTQDYPANMTTQPKHLVNKMSTLRIEGDLYKATLEGPTFAGQYNTSPQNAWWWYVCLSTVKANLTDYAINGSLVLDLYYDIEFFNRANYVTTVPT